MRTTPATLSCVAAVAALSFLPEALAQSCPTRASWPTEAWPSREAEVAAAKAAELEALEDYAFTLVGKDEERLGYRTDALLIVHRGEVIYERYGRGHDANKRHLSWSVAKSVTSTLTGVAVAAGALTLDDSICQHVQAAREESCAIRVRHLIEFSSGLDWAETYENQSYQVSSVLAMLYGEGHKDAVSFITGHRLRDEPGKVFSYSTGDATLLASVVRGALAPTHGEEYAWKLLFDRIGMKSAVQEADGKGAPLGGSSFYATPRDYARFGYLFLNDGCWEGQRILPEGWVKAATTVSASYRQSERPPEDPPAGMSWWLNQPDAEGKLPWEGVPEDAYAAQGHWGQRVVVVPSLDLVVVRFGDDRKGSMPVSELLTRAIEVAR